jgi:hypothetical protein
MANNNNIYYNEAYRAFIKGALAGRKFTSAVQASYLKVTQSAQAFAQAVDALIPFDALVTTGAAITQLAITTNTIAANEQHRAGLLGDICFSQISGSYSEDATVGDWGTAAAACVAAWNEALLLLVVP